MANEQKKPFTWEDADRQSAAIPAPGGSKKPFLWSDTDAAQPSGLSPENLAANKARNAQPTQFEKDNAMSPNERQANEFLLGAASGASGLPESLHPIKDAAASQPQTVGQAAKQAAFSAPGFGLVSSLYHAGRQLIAPPAAQGEDPNEQRAHGAGTLAGIVGSGMVGEGLDSSVDAAQGAARRQLFTPEGMKTPLGDALSNPVHKLPEYGLRKLVGAPDPEVKGSSVPIRQSPEFNPQEYNAGRKGISAPSAPPPTNTEGVAAPQADVVKVPVPRDLAPGEKVGYNASTPRKLVLDNALQGRPGAAEMLRNMGKTPLFVEEGGYAPPREKTVFSDQPQELQGNPTPFGNRMTLNRIGDTGTRPIVSPANQFESSFGPEHQEVGDLAEWETGNREGVRPKRIPVP